ncbi:MAG: lectin like domain-containing protein [Coriobacteriales bacterium]
MGTRRSLRTRGAWFGRTFLAASLAVAMVGTPVAAFAVEPDAGSGHVMQLIAQSDGQDPFAWAVSAPADGLRAASSLPATFDPRDEWVTPVKFQNPWGSCWSFAIAGASEMSILSEAKTKDIPIKMPDVSEHHLAWFTYAPLPEDDDSGQGGEGMVSVKDGNERLNAGGMAVYGTSLFSSGMGPVPEQDVPYRGDKGTIVTGTDAEGREYNYYYSPDDDWSVDEKWRFVQAVEMQESYQLPSPGDYVDAEGWNFEGLASANEAIKQQLYAGRGVAITFMADQSRPGQVSQMGYMNPGNNATGTWAHYTYDKVAINHAVTIVGWDDSYAKENFGNPDPETGKVDPAKQPPADGAWIVKNSWGSTAAFPNGYPGGWGTDGEGYFYLSYYDKTISKPEAFDFDVESMFDERAYYSIHQYDYMPSASTQSFSDSREIREANVFASEAGQTVRRLTCETTRPNTRVTYEVYHLDKDAASPVQGTKLVTLDKTYEYGGFHTVDLDDQSFSLGEGERFSVVVTQKCLDDGKYYVSFDMGFGKETLDQIRQQNHDQYYDTIYDGIFEQLRGQVWSYKYQEALTGGSSEEDARATASAFVESPDEVAKIETAAKKAAEQEIDGMSPAYYSKGVVNPGESYIFASPDDNPGANPAWRDFSGDAKLARASGAEIDNFPLKAYAYNDEADEDALKRLEDNVTWAKDLMGTAVASEDGSDVDASRYWVPADVFTELETLIGQAGELLDSKQPTQLNVDRMNEKLSTAMTKFREARKAGTAGADDPERVTMYRLYNPNSGEHFYTASTLERDATVAAGWNDEGVGWVAPDSSQTPVHRLYSGTDHHCTTSTVERDYLVSVGWSDEGIGWYSDDAQGVPLHRQFNPNVDPSAPVNNSGSHNYTTSEVERDYLVSIGWRYEGVGWYGMK